MNFLNGNIDVITRILEFVTESSEELNTYAMVSRVFRRARDNPPLDQTRTGTIIFKTSLGDILPEVWQRWDQQVFTGNRVRFVAILTQLKGGTFWRSSRRTQWYIQPFFLYNVRELILQRDVERKRENGGGVIVVDGFRIHSTVMAISFFQMILPNLDILDIGALAVNTANLGKVVINNLVRDHIHEFRATSVFRCTAEVVHRRWYFSLMQRFRTRSTAEVGHRRWHFSLMQPDFYTPSNYILREIHIDPLRVTFYLPIVAYCKEYRQLEQETWFHGASSRNGGTDWVLLQEYPNLERVTLKHVEYLVFSIDSWTDLPQEALIKFVRHTPKLRWFCSDLTQDNIAILKEERPEVEFCD
jgi:hypothetical protein